MNDSGRRHAPPSVEEVLSAPTVQWGRTSGGVAPETRAKIETYWRQAFASRGLWRGEVFRILCENRTASTWSVVLEATDYAHFIFGLDHNVVGSEACRVLYAAGVVVTDDNYCVIGKAGPKTASPGRLQLVSGGLIGPDLAEAERCFVHCLERELWEEVGLTAADLCSWGPLYRAEESNGFVAVIYTVRTSLKFLEVCQRFDSLAGIESSEFRTLLGVRLEKSAVDSFFCSKVPKVSYLDELIKILLNDAR